MPIYCARLVSPRQTSWSWHTSASWICWVEVHEYSSSLFREQNLITWVGHTGVSLTWRRGNNNNCLQSGTPPTRNTVVSDAKFVFLLVCISLLRYITHVRANSCAPNRPEFYKLFKEQEGKSLSSFPSRFTFSAFSRLPTYWCHGVVFSDALYVSFRISSGLCLLTETISREARKDNQRQNWWFFLAIRMLQ